MSLPFPPVKPNQIKPCSAKNNGQGCNRGFLREKCPKCTNGSLACEMCQHQRNRNASTSSLLLKGCPSSVTFPEQESKEQPLSSTPMSGSFPSPSPASVSTVGLMGSSTAGSGVPLLLVSSTHPSLRLNDASIPAEAAEAATVATVKTISISYQLPLPSGHPQRSLVSSTPSTPAPSKDIKLSIITLPSTLPSSTLTPTSSTDMETTVATMISPPISPLLASSSTTSSPRSLAISTTISAVDPRIHSKSCPSSPVCALGSHPFGSASTSCIFCFNGRKACDDCFGLGYVQRICQDCLRDLHQNRNHPSQQLQLPQQQQQNEHRQQPHHHRQKSLPALPTTSLPFVHVALNQIGAKIKKQFFPQQQQQQQQQLNRQSSLSESSMDGVATPSISPSVTTTSEHSPLHSSGPVSAKSRITAGLRRSQSTNSDRGSTLPEVSQKEGLFRSPKRQPRKQRPPQLRSKSMVSLGISSPRLGPLEEEVVSHTFGGKDQREGEDGEEDKVAECRDRGATAIETETETRTDGPGDREKKTFRAAVLRALKLPLFHSTASNARSPPHRRHWSMSVTNLPSTTNAT